MFDDIKKKIDRSIELSIDGIVNHAVEVLVDTSPVWTGKYVKGHIAESTAKNYPRSAFPGKAPYPAKIGSGVKSSVKATLKASAKNIMEVSGTVAINNKAKHANFVEYIGWDRKVAQMPFGKTKGSLALREKAIISKAVHKAFNS